MNALVLAFVFGTTYIWFSLWPHQTTVNRISLDPGRTAIVVSGDDWSDMSCTYTRPFTGEVLSKQLHVKECRLIVDVPVLPTYVDVSVQNTTEDRRWYEIQTYDHLMKLK